MTFWQHFEKLALRVIFKCHTLPGYVNFARKNNV